jgi:hypothetical protein
MTAKLRCLAEKSPVQQRNNTCSCNAGNRLLCTSRTLTFPSAYFREAGLSLVNSPYGTERLLSTVPTYLRYQPIYGTNLVSLVSIRTRK